MSTNGKLIIVDTKTEDQAEKRYTVIEENNNEIRILATNFEGMGNISDKFKDKSSNRLEVKDSGTYRIQFCDSTTTIDRIDNNRKYDYGSDEFEEDVDDEGGPRVTVATVHRNGDVSESRKKHSEKPQTTKKDEVEKKGAAVVAGINEETKKLETTDEPVAKGSIVSRKSASSVSTLVRPKRINMSFSNQRTKEIHRDNHILMKRLLKTNSSRASTPVDTYSREANSAILRRRKQERTHYENLVLLRKLQTVKSSNFSFRT